MSIRKVHVDNPEYTYSSYVVAGDFIFTSIRSAGGDTLREQAEGSIRDLENLIKREGVTLDDVVKVTVTFKKSHNFEDIKDVFAKYFKNGYPARNTIIVNEFLGNEILFQIEAIVYKQQKDK